ncbi:polyamine aminopropyltransferase [Deferribacter abyssi]|uniref:polyamine aminopropyltransferase n=1 Tax=Deferribacter abyssi TaxID=213806 RepID=UPI003C1669BB
MELWFTEKYENNTAFSIKIKKTLYSGKSPYQKIDILESEDLGRILLLDDFIMLTEAHEFAYHEMIAHVPLYAHPNPENVLIIGGGDGGTAREVVKHDIVKKCVMCEIDGMVVEKSKEFLPTVASAFDNPKLNLMIDDGVKFIKDNKDSFDVIIIDSTDPIGPAEGLFKQEFYRHVFKCLKDDGIMVAQAENPYYYTNIQKDMFNNLKAVFPIVAMYLSFIPFYPSGMWAFAFASKKYRFNDNPRISDIKNMEKSFKYFNKDIFYGCFALPNFAKEVL